MGRAKHTRIMLFLAGTLLAVAVSASAASPRVVKTIPENGDQSVDPGLKQIRIEFDQDMDGARYSVCGGGPKFPKTIGKGKWINNRTFAIRVRLEPDHEYELSVNCPSYQNFRNVHREPAVIYPITFKTAASGRMEKLPRKSPGVLLQEGLYAEETEGDLDKAIGIYEQVVDQFKENERIAAKATYQLGLCHLKKGQETEAADYFEDVVDSFPNQTVLVKKATSQLVKLRPAPTDQIPLVIRTYPANYANNVSPDVNAISVTFNRRMADKSWSWVQWNWPFPERAGEIYYDRNRRTCTMPVKLEPGKAYFVRINAGEYMSFRSADGVPAQPYVLVFATQNEAGKPTTIPQEMLSFAKETNAESPAIPLTQEKYDRINSDGTIDFVVTTRQVNESDKPVTEDRFINSDFVHVTGMFDEKDRPLEFTAKHEGNIYRYHVKFNEPFEPGQVISYSHKGTVTGLIQKVPGVKDTFRYYMRHSPGTGRPTLRIETYSLPEGARLLSMTPQDMEQREIDGRIELHVEEMIPPGGSITTAFQYKLSGATLASAEPLKLSTTPFFDGETMRLKLSTPAGAEIGQIIWQCRSVERNGEVYDRIESYMHIAVTNQQQYTAVDAQRDSFLPVRGVTKNWMGEFEAVYDEGSVNLTTQIGGKETTKDISVDGAVYDNEQALYLIRSLPLEVGYGAEFDIFPVQSGSVAKCRIDVTDIETVGWQGGEMECYAIKLAVYAAGVKALEHTLWISTDEHRWLVKYDSGQALMNLMEAGKTDLDQPQQVFDAATDCSFSIPAGWHYVLVANPGRYKASVQILPPELNGWSVLTVFERISGLLDTPRDAATMDIEVLKGFFTNYTVRENSWTDLTVGQMPAVSYVADYEDKERSMVEYRTYILGKSLIYWFVFRIEKGEFERNKVDFDSIVNSFKANAR